MPLQLSPPTGNYGPGSVRLPTPTPTKSLTPVPPKMGPPTPADTSDAFQRKMAVDAGALPKSATPDFKNDPSVALAARVAKFEGSDLNKLARGKQLPLSADLLRSAVTEGIPKLFRSILGVQTANAGEAEALANATEAAGFPEDADRIRKGEQVRQIHNLSDQEILDRLDEPSTFRSVTREFAKMSPAIAASLVAAPEEGAALAADSLLATVGKRALAEIPSGLIYSLLTRNPDDPLSKQLMDGAANLAMIPVVTGGMTLGLGAAERSLKDVKLANILQKLDTELRITPDERQYLRETYRSQVLFGEQRMAALKGAEEGTPGIDFPTAPPADPRAALLDEVRRITKPDPEKQSFLQRVKGGYESTVNALHDHIVSQFGPLKRAEGQLYERAGEVAPRVDMARKFEQVAGAAGKGEADVVRLKREVIDPAHNMYDEMVDYLFLQRTASRLRDNPELKQVGNWTTEKVQVALGALRDKVGPQGFGVLQDASHSYQDIWDDSLKNAVGTLIDQETYNAIKASNDFYAPFKLLKHLEENGAVAGNARGVATTQQSIKAITGIHDADFQLGDILQQSAEKLYTTRLLVEKNKAMIELGRLADLDAEGSLIKKAMPDRIFPGEGGEKALPNIVFGTKPRPGYQIVEYMENGSKKALEMRKDMAEAIQGMNGAQASLLVRAAQIPAGAFRLGVTTLNAGFQVVNALFADTPRNAIMFKYGNAPQDLLRFPLDWVKSYYDAMAGNFGFKNSGYEEFMRSGSFNSTVQRLITPEAFATHIRPPTSFLQRVGRHANVIEDIARFANAVEEGGKILGFQRGLREVNRKFGYSGLSILEPNIKASPKYAEAISELITEVRNYAGSPDFARRGKSTAPLNLLFMFMNARIQGTAADLSRLSGRSGGGTAQAWAKLGGIVGVPATTLAVYNQVYHSEDLAALPSWERNNYFHIFTGKYFINEDGQRIADAYRIPKREIVQLFGNIIEDGVQFAFDRDPQSALVAGMDMLKGIVPVNMDGKDVTEVMQSVLSSMNPVIKTPVEYATGVNSFQHRRTVPKGLDDDRSPALQYIPGRTPDVFVKLGQLTNQSPIKLEQAAGGITGGFVNQFTLKEPLAGRSTLSELPVFKRFFRSQYKNEEKIQAEAYQVKTASADKKALREMDAEKLWAEMSSLPKSQRNARYAEIKRRDKKLAEKIKEVAWDEKNGLTFTERTIKSLGVEDGTRAAFIRQMQKELPTSEERKQLLRTLIDKGVVSDQVLDQIKALRNAGR